MPVVNITKARVGLTNTFLNFILNGLSLFVGFLDFLLLFRENNFCNSFINRFIKLFNDDVDRANNADRGEPFAEEEIPLSDGGVAGFLGAALKFAPEDDKPPVAGILVSWKGSE